MKWFKHLVDSGDDPDINESIALFGKNGYYYFFRCLEIMSREFDVTNPGHCEFILSWFFRRFQLKVKTTRECLEFYHKKKRIYYEIIFKTVGSKRLEYIHLNCPKLKEHCDEYTSRILKEKSGHYRDNEKRQYRDNVGTKEEEEEEERELERELERNKKEKTSVCVPDFFYPAWLNAKLWEEYKKHRVELKSKMTQRAESLAISKLFNLIESGYDQETIINTSIMNGWKGLFAPKNRSNNDMHNNILKAGNSWLKNQKSE